MEVIKQLLSNEYFVWCAMAVIIFCLTQLLKLPIKAATKHIKNEKARKIANKVIVLIPVLLGLLAEFLYGTLLLPAIGMAIIPFNGATGLSYASGSIMVYSIFEIKTGIKIENPYTDTEEGKAVVELIEKVQSDGKLDEQDLSEVEKFWKTVGKDNSEK